MNTPSTPDVTKAQLLAAVTWIVSQLVAVSAIDPGTGKTIVQVTGTVFPAAWVIADAVIRWARNRHHAVVASAEIYQRGQEPTAAAAATDTSPPLAPEAVSP